MLVACCGIEDPAPLLITELVLEEVERPTPFRAFIEAITLCRLLASGLVMNAAEAADEAEALGGEARSARAAELLGDSGTELLAAARARRPDWRLCCLTATESVWLPGVETPGEPGLLLPAEPGGLLTLVLKERDSGRKPRRG